MRRFRHRVRSLVALLAVIFLLFVGSTAQAQSVTLTQDIDLVAQNGLAHYSQTDGRWAYYSVRGDPTVTLGRCGCLLSAFATVIGQQGGMLPWFPTRFDYFGGYDGAFDFNPRYLDIFLNYGLSVNYPSGWGYKASPSGTCGVIPLVQALQTVGTDGFGSAVGFTPVVHAGFGPDVMDIVNRNLLAGRPTIAAIRVRDSLVANHAVLIAGWDAGDHAYKILDPMTPRAGLHGLNLPAVPQDVDPGDPAGTAATYQKWEMRVEGIIEMRQGGFSGSQPSFMFGDDPSPIEILMTGPDGRRTGVDPASSASYAENDGASYWTFGPWSDPLGEIPQGTAPRFIVFPNAPAGTYHFTVTGTSAGPLELSAETLFGGTRVLLGAFNGTIAAGEARKYELRFARTGASTVAQVQNFTPHAYAGDDIHVRTDTPIAFDGRRSFDADGAIASYAWDFGDGSTGVGPQPQHVYAVPGDYAVRLTVTDAGGIAVSDVLQANVILSQRRPIANASGPYLGFASTNPDVYVLLDARGSSDPNRDPLTYRWNFGDGSPVRTTTAGYADHTYAEVGVYTMTVVANDGLEDSAPATARVEIVPAPTAPPFGAVNGFLTPTCGAPGSTTTLTLGEFAQFQWWNFATMGALPPFPPGNLVLGVRSPDGMMSLGLPGGGSRDVPFSATLLSPGRYLARATIVVPDLPPGMYQVRWGEVDSLPFQVPCPVPANRAPRANAGGPYASGVDSAIAFDGRASSDPDGDALTYAWDFGDGALGEGVRPSHAYAHAGRYIVTLLVSDGQSGSTATAGTRSFAAAAVTLTNNPPAFAPPANITRLATSSAGAVVTFSAAGTDVEDGAIPAVCAPASGSTFPIATTTVNCTVTDSRGAMATGAFTVTVTTSAAAPVSVAGGAYFMHDGYQEKIQVSVSALGGVVQAPSSLSYYYVKTRMNLVSTQILAVDVTGETATITGTAAINRVAGYRFVAIVQNGAPDAFGITITRADGSLFYAISPGLVAAGDLVIR